MDIKEEIAHAYAKRAKTSIDKKLGQETNGAAFLMTNGFVVKVTEDVREVVMAAKTIKEKLPAPVNKVHEIEKMGYGQYVIVQDYAPQEGVFAEMKDFNRLNMLSNYYAMKNKFKGSLTFCVVDMPQSDYDSLSVNEKKYVDFIKTIPNDITHKEGNAQKLDIKQAHFGVNSKGEKVVFDLSDFTIDEEHAKLLLATEYKAQLNPKRTSPEHNVSLKYGLRNEPH